jgi:hypothetical protein
VLLPAVLFQLDVLSSFFSGVFDSQKIHESYGVQKGKGGSTTFINAAICNVLCESEVTPRSLTRHTYFACLRASDKADHAPIVFDMPRPSAAAGSKS